jgi:UDP-glucose 4-epimerase
LTLLVTGSAGHLGEAIMRTLRARGRAAIGLDIVASPYTDLDGSVADRALVERAMRETRAVIHAASLHKPHLATHSKQDFVHTNVSGTLALLEAAVAARVEAFVFTSTTSAFGASLSPPPGAPAAWIDEGVAAVAKNVYGATKTAAEELCRVFAREHALPCVVLRTARFFPERDDDPAKRDGFDDSNVKVNEFLNRRADVEDLVEAHLIAVERAKDLHFDRFVLSATTPFTREDCAELRRDSAAVLARRVPQYAAVYAERGWRMFPALDRVYDNAHARERLGWRPRWDFAYVLERLRCGDDFLSPLARAIGKKGYHGGQYADGEYPVR